MATNNLLTQPAPDYRRFVDNQVLTDDQLNGVLDYLNHQDRFSRLLLHGVGAVCGLNVSIDSSGSEVLLSEGVAVTTAGDLLKTDAEIYTGFRKFDDSNVKYPFFTDEEGATIDLWELKTDTEPSDVDELSMFEAAAGIPPGEAVALLYLEDYVGEEEDCSPVDCDNRGRPVINELRLLLVSQEHARSIAERDSVFSGLLDEEKTPALQELPRLYVPRVLLTDANTKSFDSLKQAYTVSFRTLSDHIAALGNIALFKKTFDEADFDPAGDLLNTFPSVLNFQYVYGFYKDLVTACNELRDLMRKNYALCCPDPEAFPKHILLGAPGSEEKIWRHRFYPSPTHMESAVGEMRRACRRLLEMIRDFRATVKNEVRITPSRDDDNPLGERAVPFYYDLENSADAPVFLNNWKKGDSELVPNYYQRGYPEEGFNPLDVCLGGHDFYRIEGHVGKHVTDAHKAIRDIQENKSLPFDVKQVAVGAFPDEETIDYEKYRVYFEDLQVVLQAWNEEQQCLMKSVSKFLTEFSTKDPGGHLAYPAAEAGSVENDNNDVVFREGMSFTEFSPAIVSFGVTAQPKTAKENYVVKNLSAEENTLGFAMKEAIAITDNKNDIWVKTNHALGDVIRDWDADIVEAVINIPGQLIGYLKETEDHKLTDIEDFTEENLQKYLESLKEQCRKTTDSKKRLQQLISKDDSVIRSQEWLENYLYILNRVTSSCCLIEKVKVLYEKIIERKKELLEQFVLDNFIREHPGAEHKAGVERGGTFILLYYSKKRDQQKPVPDVGRPETLTRFEAGVSPQPVPLERTLVQPSGIPGRIPATLDLRWRTELERPRLIPSFFPGAGRTPIRENIPDGTVIGDLCLPYICCTGSPATNFIFPEQLATLRIPVDHVCVDADGDTEPIPLTVTPPGGTVTAFIQSRELEGVITENENGTFFDPNEVSPDDYGREVRFEVNGQTVEAALEVYQKPTAGFAVSDEIAFSRNNRAATVVFRNTSEPFGDLTFEWDFAGDIVENQNALEFNHTFQVRPGENFDFEVKLTAFNGPCEAVFTESVNIDVPELEGPVEPEDPVRNCTEITTGAVKASLSVMDRYQREHADGLTRAFREVYSGKVTPLFEEVLENPDVAFSGRLDDDTFPVIQELQENFARTLENRQSAAQRRFLLMIYYELGLLYLYMHACRDGQIPGDITVHRERDNWLTFTRQAIERFSGVVKTLLETDAIHKKLDVVRQQAGSRFDDRLQGIVDKVIDQLSRADE